LAANLLAHIFVLYLKIKIMKKVLMGLVFAATAATTIMSCDKESAPIVATPKEPRLMVVHASADTIVLDALIDNTKKNTSAIAYLANTGYFDVSAGKKVVKINRNGSGKLLTENEFTFEKNRSYTLFSANKYANIEAVLISDDVTTPADGKALVRFVHLGADAPPVDIAVTGGLVLFPGLAFKKHSAFQPVAPGVVALEARLAGTTVVALPVGNVTFVAGKQYTVFARGLISNNTLGVTIIENN
jgi:hypothetical protein